MPVQLILMGVGSVMTVGGGLTAVGGFVARSLAAREEMEGLVEERLETLVTFGDRLDDLVLFDGVSGDRAEAVRDEVRRDRAAIQATLQHLEQQVVVAMLWARQGLAALRVEALQDRLEDPVPHDGGRVAPKEFLDDLEGRLEGLEARCSLLQQAAALHEQDEFRPRATLDRLLDRLDEAGLGPGWCAEHPFLDEPDRVRALHRSREADPVACLEAWDEVREAEDELIQRVDTVVKAKRVLSELQERLAVAPPGVKKGLPLTRIRWATDRMQRIFDEEAVRRFPRVHERLLRVVATVEERTTRFQSVGRRMHRMKDRLEQLRAKRVRSSKASQQIVLSGSRREAQRLLGEADDYLETAERLLDDAAADHDRGALDECAQVLRRADTHVSELNQRLRQFDEVWSSGV